MTVFFPCAVLLNANRVGSTGKRTRLGVQGKSRRPLTISICALSRWTTQFAFSDVAQQMKSGINNELLVSVPQTHLARMRVFKCDMACIVEAVLNELTVTLWTWFGCMHHISFSVMTLTWPWHIFPPSSKFYGKFSRHRVGVGVGQASQKSFFLIQWGMFEHPNTCFSLKGGCLNTPKYPPRYAYAHILRWTSLIEGNCTNMCVCVCVCVCVWECGVHLCGVKMGVGWDYRMFITPDNKITCVKVFTFCGLCTTMQKILFWSFFTPLEWDQTPCSISTDLWLIRA